MNHFRRVLTPVIFLALGFACARLFPPQVSAQAPAGKPFASGLVRAEEALPTRGAWGEWRRYFRGETLGTKDMVVLAVTLKPGEAPHPPHRHAEEEFMILAAGAGTWHVEEKVLPGRVGDVVYAAPWTLHGIRNTGEGPLTYYLVKWNNKGVSAPEEPASGKASGR